MVLIMILSLGIGPFTQQAIGTEPCPEPVNGQAMIPHTRYVYWPIQNFTDYPKNVRYYSQPPSDIETTIYSSLMGPAGVASNIRFQCTTGNCTFNNHGDPINTTDFDGAQAFSTMGLCHKCVNISHLISSEQKVQNDTGRRYLAYSLPNVHHDGPQEVGGLRTIRIFENGASTEVFRSMVSDLSWAGNEIPQEVQDISTSAIANITILACNNKRCNGQRSDICASTCVLYPCIRSYTVSITNGELVQEQISTSPTIIGGSVQGREMKNDYDFPIFGNSEFLLDWVAVKSPCRIGDRIYWFQKVSSDLEPSTTWYCVNGTDAHHRECEGMMDPQYCLYRQDNGHGQAVSSVLTKYFKQYCIFEDDLLKCNSYPSFIQENVADVLFQRGNITTKAINEYFDDVAVSITNQYRNRYGRTPPKSWVASAEDPPFGEVHGVVLQTKTCNAIHLQWLAFPTAIIFIATGLFLWTIAESWGKRGNRPVWKDHILPLLLYSNRFKRGVDDSTITEESHTDGRNSTDDNERLLETDEMEKLAVNLQVRFQWPGDEDTKAEAVLRRKKGPRDVDVDSLLQE
ncbi:hypothetical protein PG991_003011 [Apiospora marii]|uniref:Uncharacterized protein n=1 Tax=Apiospora marii TaxID=335849 RepID=A0ABR1SGZ3_9PEZI